jgi:dimethylaniline monooxygenase (N-oxide forming)
MVSPKHVCVIGAGVSGLAAAKVFSARGHKVTICDKSAELGGVWEPARTYPEVQTQSPKDLYRYTDRAMPASYPEWPTGPQVHAYLGDYAKSFGLDRMLRLNTNVEAMTPRADGRPGWTLTLSDQNGTTSREDFDFVAVCTGQFNDPQELHCPGEADFTAGGGRILHSSKYNDPSLAKDRRVVVLGGSKSATDIAVSAVNSGAREVTIVFREPVWRIPYFIGGLVNFKRILYIRAQEQMFQGWGASAAARLAYRIAAPMIWANWRGLESLLKAQLKLKKCNMVPEGRIEDGINCSVPIATPNFFQLVADGRIKAIRGTFDHYERGAVVISGGERVQADVAVLAIGYKLGVPFLPEPYRAKLVDADGQYRLYRLIANPDLPNMGFVGFNSSFCSVLSADLAANWLVRYADGQLARQPTTQQMRDNIEMMLHFKRVERPAAGVYGGLCVAPYHYRHFDELMADIGAKQMRRNALAERFLPPDADAYARYLASAPDYRAA